MVFYGAELKVHFVLILLFGLSEVQENGSLLCLANSNFSQTYYNASQRF